MASIPLRPSYICTQCIRSLRPQFRAPTITHHFTPSRTLRTGTRSLRRRTRFAHSSSDNTKTNVERVSASTSPAEPPPTLEPTPPSRAKAPKPPKPLALTDSIHAYWETLAPTRSQKSDADIWFTKSAKPQFLRSVALFRTFPESDVPEVAFVGRSNVGKSSLLNALVNADIKEVLARVSKTPGCTKTLNLYGVGPHDGVRVRKGKNNGHDRIVGIGGLLVVDLPGYGEGSLSEWGTEIMKYLTQRKQLRRVFVLVDAGVGIKESDRSLLASLRMAGVPHQVLMSKLDKVYLPEDAREMVRFDGKARNSCKPRGSESALLEKLEEIRSEVKPPQGAGALGELLGVSSEVVVDGKRLGMDAVRVAVLRAAGVKYESKSGKARRREKEANKAAVATPKVEELKPARPSGKKSRPSPKQFA